MLSFLGSAAPLGGVILLVSFSLDALIVYGLVALVIGLIAWSKLTEPPLASPYPVVGPAVDPVLDVATSHPPSRKGRTDPKNRQRQKLSRVARELGTLIRRQAHEKWDLTQVAKRNERGHHVWRFRIGTGETERFLRVSRKAMIQGENPSRVLFDQLQAGRWLDRLHEGPETALLLTRGGQIRSWPRQ